MPFLNRHPKPRVWFQEYEFCGCTQVADRKEDLPQCCPDHKYIYRTRAKIDDTGFTRGHWPAA